MCRCLTVCGGRVCAQELKQTMAGLLRLHMSLQNEAQGDEQVGGQADGKQT
jgi:hypothetical protein